MTLAMGLVVAKFSPVAAGQVTEVVLLEYGIYTEKTVQVGTSPEGVPINRTIGFRLIRTTQRVPISEIRTPAGTIFLHPTMKTTKRSFSFSCNYYR